MTDSVVVKVERLVSQCVDSLVDDDPRHAAEGLRELANMMAKAGYGRELFIDTRKRIILLASHETNRPFITEKLKIAEEDLWKKLREGDAATATQILTH